MEVSLRKGLVPRWWIQGISSIVSKGYIVFMDFTGDFLLFMSKMQMEKCNVRKLFGTDSRCSDTLHYVREHVPVTHIPAAMAANLCACMIKPGL